MLVAPLPGIRRASGPVPVTADVRQKYMPAAIVYFESDG